ncbi:c-type cytochrome [Saccharospirillum impatiens]|uniref:c-type cytochrome n=1 Tax=Saccharospirillum impatiens TaxID=169438 RepID=UPI00049121C0|nr:cytochrome c [Saccharospirillum impatiens]
MNKSVKAMLMGVSALLAVNVWAEGDVDAGKAKSAVCAACHGANGVSSVPIYPNLAGQKEAYLVNVLAAYKSQQRQGANAAVMWGIAASLSEQDIANLAAYYASLPAGG